MEPRQQGLSAGHEAIPSTSGEYGFGLNPERDNTSGERHEQRRSEVGVVVAEAAQVAMPALPTPVIADPQVSSTQISDDDTPSAAGDDDLIEKEWVDKAKKIITDTRDDPYRREKEISKLQIEYIRKRYGREVGESGD